MSRNGRSSSQISIDNYPEHLNPFYEDDNHKRLRFWNLKKKSSDKERRSSFSIENLRDIWTFKSFSLKKKSSTLGINKTSESPPVLRRQLNEPCDYNNFLNTRDRYSEAGTSPMRNELNLSYRRPYRSSLQNIDAKSENGSMGNAFNRNDMYRATTQSVGYLTPNFRRNHQTRLSQSSLSSTNPFESDVETNVDSISTTSRKSYRKKRRAPLPPPRATINNEITTDTITTDNTNGNLDIKSLTSEIEQFVNITNESLDNPDPPAKVERVTTRTQPNNLIKSNVQLSSFAPEKDLSKNTDGHDTKIVHVESASASPQTILRIDENRNFSKNQTSEAEVTAPARRGRPSANQKIETSKLANQILLPDRLQIIEKTSHVYKFENLSDTISDRPTNDSKVVSETVTSKAQSVLKTKDEAQDYKLKNTKEALTKQTTKEDTTEKPQINDEIVVVKPETDVKPKIIKTYEFPSDQAREDSNTMTQKVVIKASLSKTENTNNVLQNFGSANGSANGTPTRMPTDRAIEEKAPIKSIFQNTEPSTNNNILFIEEQSISTGSISKHKELPSEVLIQGPIMPNGSSLPKNPQNEIVLTSSPKIGLYGQETKFKFNVGNAQTFSSPPNEHLHQQNDEPTLSTSKGTENIDAAAALNQAGKKRSVREVIESINRSQRMLNESIAKGTKIYSTPLFVEHKNTHSNELNSFNTKSTQIMETKNISVTTVSSNEGSGVEPQPNVFHKSKINKMVCDYRESSPTASNLDWNPLPKPKRTNNNC
ncbi:uncharacterized protein [Drosophila tropicalis]|uniref:uncharacterized protein n=1 Tax=Drosophila tropicalis TaxID=46794 RepID=UPI0035AB79A0